MGHGKRKIYTRIDSLEKSAGVVFNVTGKSPPIHDLGVQMLSGPYNIITPSACHLSSIFVAFYLIPSGVRARRAREHAISVYRWNAALQAISEQITHSSAGCDRLATRDLMRTSQQMFSMAGFREGTYCEGAEMPTEIEGYSRWTIERITIVSRHTAIFHFRNADRKRGTPNPRGGSGRTTHHPKTWHTTLLAEVNNPTLNPNANPSPNHRRSGEMVRVPCRG